MTRQDCIDWAEEYRREADALEQEIQQRRKELPKKYYYDDKQLNLLYEMKSDCLYTMKILIKKAEKIEGG